MGQRLQWRDGQPVVPIDLSVTSPVRASFSKDVLGLSVEAVQMHWMKLITAGRGRPPYTASEEDVLKTVGKERWMIGYVSAEAVLPPTVRNVPLRE
jgi:hypothetical protein